MSRKITNKAQETLSQSSSPSQPSEKKNGGNGHTEMPATGGGSISAEAIAARAYDIYQREGRMDGRDMDHWLRAEAELRAETETNRERETNRSRGGTITRPDTQEAPRSMRQTQGAR